MLVKILLQISTDDDAPGDIEEIASLCKGATLCFEDFAPYLVAIQASKQDATLFVMVIAPFQRFSIAARLLMNPLILADSDRPDFPETSRG